MEKVIENLKEWLYQIAMNNATCPKDMNLADACEEIISRLDGLKAFVKEGGGECQN